MEPIEEESTQLDSSVTSNESEVINLNNDQNEEQEDISNGGNITKENIEIQTIDRQAACMSYETFLQIAHGSELLNNTHVLVVHLQHVGGRGQFLIQQAALKLGISAINLDNTMGTARITTKTSLYDILEMLDEQLNLESPNRALLLATIGNGDITKDISSTRGINFEVWSKDAEAWADAFISKKDATHEHTLIIIDTNLKPLLEVKDLRPQISQLDRTPDGRKIIRKAEIFQPRDMEPKPNRRKTMFTPQDINQTSGYLSTSNIPASTPNVSTNSTFISDTPNSSYILTDIHSS